MACSVCFYFNQRVGSYVKKIKNLAVYFEIMSPLHSRRAPHMYIPIHVCQTSTLPVIIRDIVLKSISDIATIQLHCSKLEIRDAIKCPAHAKENHVALWDCETDEYECLHDDACTGPIPEDCKIWRNNTGLIS